MTVRIVPLSERHIDAMLEIERRSFSTPWSRGMLTFELENPLALYLVVEGEAGEILGYAGMHRVLDEGYITNVAVSEQWRRRGIAFQVLSALIETARLENLVLLTLEVRESNMPARRFYEKLLFKTVGRRKNYYTDPTEDALLMALTVSEEGGAKTEDFID